MTMNVLLLDDNLMSAMRIENNLRTAGHTVKAARTAPAEGDYELLVFNLGSRSLDGLSHLESWRTRFANAKIWAFCGHREVELWRAARGAGVDRILTNEVAMTEIGNEVTDAGV